MNRIDPPISDEHPDDRADEEAEGFAIESSDAYVACAPIDCMQCGRAIEVIGLYCRRGSVSAEPLEAFAVQSIWAMDSALARQLDRWPAFRLSVREGAFLNHCRHCGAVQDETLLYEETEQPFYGLARRVPAQVRLVPLSGRVRMSGDYSVEIGETGV